MDVRDPRARMILFIRSLGEQAGSARPGPYRDGFIAALFEMDEFVTEELWEEGEDASELDDLP
jgi:hypothetical protein